jgi:steroid 5-alpha reductase family enzyme
MPVLAELLRLSLAGALLAGVAFGGAYAVYRRTDNAAIVDAVWSFTLGGTGVLYAALGAGHAPRRLLLALMAGAWGVRLGAHLLRRVIAEPEDARYQRLRDGWRAQGRDVHRQMARFYGNQAVSVVGLALPFALAAREPRPAAVAWLAGAALVFAAGWLLETVADAQLRTFRQRVPHGGVCDVGVWGWSRHPNYFGEWLAWVAFALLALPTAWGALALAAPVAMLVLLLRVTGVPLTEAHLLATRGDAYRAYQARVSMFVPRPPRHHIPPPGASPG